MHGGEWGLSISVDTFFPTVPVKGQGRANPGFNWEYRAAAKCPRLKGDREGNPLWNAQIGSGLVSWVIITQQFLFQNQP